jgi:predicted nucleotidyltransferase
MDIFDDEILKLWRSLLNNRVDFIMIGGVATNLHGFQRTTDDIDIWIKDSLENRKNLRKAFKE